MSTSTSTSAWFSKANYPLCAVVGLVTLTSVYLNAKARVNSTPGKRVKQVSAPPTPWLDKDAFLVLSAIVDTFVPSYSLSEVSDEKLSDIVRSYDLYDCIPNAPMDVAAIAKHRAFLCAGALDYGTHHHLMKALDKNLSTSEKDKIKGLLAVLGTSIGSLLLTGYPVPFPDLPLSLREKVLLMWRDHPVEQIRSIFQLFKRGVSVTYMSALNNENSSSHANGKDSDNPLWQAIGYDPDAARRNVEMSPKDIENDRILRSQVSVNISPALLVEL